MTPTPYAVLGCRPLDDDDAVRRQFHALAQHQHPDRTGAGGEPGPLWYAIAAAYAAIKTLPLRQRWATAMRAKARRCKACVGFGVRGTRAAGMKVAPCPACAGTGEEKR